MMTIPFCKGMGRAVGAKSVGAKAAGLGKIGFLGETVH